ncbi:hypothetical protein D3C81_1148440 [compost metagenome]
MATTATDSAVKKTTKKAKLPIIRHHFFISLYEIDHAASHSKGGRKIRKITSGSIVTTGNVGIKLTIKPAKTSKMG